MSGPAGGALFIFDAPTVLAGGVPLFFFFMSRATTPATMTPIAASPPITPPTIPPIGVFFVFDLLIVVALPVPAGVVDAAAWLVVDVAAPPSPEIVLKAPDEPADAVLIFVEVPEVVSYRGLQVLPSVSPRNVLRKVSN
jgi:hypothetical protein